jgi:hypothetical protein
MDQKMLELAIAHFAEFWNIGSLMLSKSRQALACSAEEPRLTGKRPDASTKDSRIHRSLDTESGRSRRGR